MGKPVEEPPGKGGREDSAWGGNPPIAQVDRGGGGGPPAWVVAPEGGAPEGGAPEVSVEERRARRDREMVQRALRQGTYRLRIPPEEAEHAMAVLEAQGVLAEEGSPLQVRRAAEEVLTNWLVERIAVEVVPIRGEEEGGVGA